MKFSISMLQSEALNVFGKGYHVDRELEISLNGRKFSCFVVQHSVGALNSGWWSRTGELEITVYGEGSDKKAQELAQAKLEVNRTKEAHKEAQRKLSALMEEDNVK